MASEQDLLILSSLGLPTSAPDASDTIAYLTHLTQSRANATNALALPLPENATWTIEEQQALLRRFIRSIEEELDNVLAGQPQPNVSPSPGQSNIVPTTSQPTAFAFGTPSTLRLDGTMDPMYVRILPSPQYPVDDDLYTSVRFLYTTADDGQTRNAATALAVESFRPDVLLNTILQARLDSNSTRADLLFFLPVMKRLSGGIRILDKHMQTVVSRSLMAAVPPFEKSILTSMLGQIDVSIPGKPAIADEKSDPFKANENRYKNAFIAKKNIPDAFNELNAAFTALRAEAGRHLGRMTTTPLTDTDLFSSINTIVGDAWLARVSIRAADEPGRFDAAGTTDFWVNYTYFPAVVDSPDGNVYAFFIPIIYSNFALTSDILRHTADYKPISYKDPLTGLPQQLFLDHKVLGDENALRAVISSINYTFPTPGTYLSFCIGLPFKGASCGLAVAAAIMGSPPIAYSGFIVGTDPLVDDDVVELVDRMQDKAKLAIREQWPIIFAHRSTDGKRQLVESTFKEYAFNVFTSGMYDRAIKYVPTKHYIILATTLMEAIYLGIHAYRTAFESRLDLYDPGRLARGRLLLRLANYETSKFKDRKLDLDSTLGQIGQKKIEPVYQAADEGIAARVAARKGQSTTTTKKAPKRRKKF